MDFKQAIKTKKLESVYTPNYSERLVSHDKRMDALEKRFKEVSEVIENIFSEESKGLPTRVLILNNIIAHHLETEISTLADSLEKPFLDHRAKSLEGYPEYIKNLLKQEAMILSLDKFHNQLDVVEEKIEELEKLSQKYSH